MAVSLSCAAVAPKWFFALCISAGQKPGSVFVPIHWTDQFASHARVDALVEGYTDPLSGQPEFKFTPVAVAPYPAVLARLCGVEAAPQQGGLDYWALARTKGGFRLELAGLSPAEDWTAFAHACCRSSEGADLLAYHDAGAGQYRFAAFEDDRMTGALFIARDPVSVSRSWACEQLGSTVSEPRDRLRMLAGRAASRRRGPWRHRLLVLRGGREANRQRGVDGPLLRCRADRQDTARGHKLRLMPDGNPKNHRGSARSEGHMIRSRLREKGADPPFDNRSSAAAGGVTPR